MMLTFIPALFIFAAVPVVQAAPSTERARGQPKWGLEWGSGPIRWRAKRLFDPALQLTPEQQALLIRMDAVELRGLSVHNLRPSEVISAIRRSLADAHISDIVIRVDPSLDTLDAYISFSQRDMRLVNALKYLSGLCDPGRVSYTLSGREIVVGRPPAPK